MNKLRIFFSRCAEDPGVIRVFVSPDMASVSLAAELVADALANEGAQVVRTRS